MKTRAKKPTAATKPKPDEVAKVTLKTLEATAVNPPRTFVLPKNILPSARILNLPNPVTLQPSRYLACPKQGFYEFTRVTAAKGTCGSWLLAPGQSKAGGESEDQAAEDGQTEESDDQGYVLQAPDLFIATPIDPLFLVLPALWPDTEQNYQAFHDRMFLVEGRKDRYVQLRSLLNEDDFKPLQDMLEKRMAVICRILDTGDERLYHLDLEKLSTVILKKAEKMVEVGLPATLEERFIKQALDIPVLAVKREESGMSFASDAYPGADDDAENSSAETSQKSNDLLSNSDTLTPATSFSVTEVDESQASTLPTPQVSKLDSITPLLRLRTTIDFILASYVTKDLRAALEKTLDKILKSRVDFQPLDDHLAHIATLKSEAVALRSISDNVSRKRGVLDDEDALERAESKKRKKEEEEARKKSMSHGVKKLAKVNISGMKKMSSFFAKAPAKK